MINKVHHLINFISLTIISLFILSIISWKLFFEQKIISQTLKNLFGLLGLLTPLAITGTLFGTLKEHQSGKKETFNYNTYNHRSPFFSNYYYRLILCGNI